MGSSEPEQEPPPFEGTPEEQEAALKIQAIARGKKGRKKANKKKLKKKKSEEPEEPLTPLEDFTQDHHDAASKIAAGFKGKKGRKKAHHVKQKKEKDDHRKKHNPKIGEVGEGDGDEEEEPHCFWIHARDKPGRIALDSTETVLKLFGKDGGAYMRTNHQRSCRDVPMCCSFLMYWACMLYLADYGWKHGDVDTLFYPMTFEGTPCGMGSLENYKALYYPWVATPEVNTCVSECPTPDSRYANKDNVIPPLNNMDPADNPFNTFICTHQVELDGRFDYNPAKERNFKDPGDNYKAAMCGVLSSGIPGVPEIPKECAAGLGLEPTGPCWHAYGTTKNVLFQCIPIELASNVTELLLEQMAGQVGAQHFNDVYEFRWIILASCGVALIVSFLWIFFLDKFAGPLIWFTVYSLCFSLPLVSLTAFYQAGVVDLSSQMPPDVLAKMESLQHSAESTQQYAYTVGVACLIGDAVLIAVFCIFKERISISIGVIEEAGDCFLDVPECIIVPLVSFVFQFPIAIWGVISTLLIVSLRQFDHVNEQWVYDEDLKLMLAFNGAGFMWLMYTISSIQYTTIAASCAKWYFSMPEDPKGDPHDKDLDTGVVLGGLYRTLRFNLGSMVFGGLIITIVVIAKWVATYFIQQVMAQSPENKIVKALGACLLCVVHCIEKFVR